MTEQQLIDKIAERRNQRRRAISRKITKESCQGLSKCYNYVYTCPCGNKFGTDRPIKNIKITHCPGCQI